MLLVAAGDPGPRSLLEVSERADGAEWRAVCERDVDDGEGPVLGDEAEALDPDLALEAVAGDRVGADQGLLRAD